jgi:uncharacterized protein (UPF0305 family)
VIPKRRKVHVSRLAASTEQTEAQMADERTEAVTEAIAKLRQACDDIEEAWGKRKGQEMSDERWERIEAARNRLESSERRLRTLLETRPGSAVE